MLGLGLALLTRKAYFSSMNKVNAIVLREFGVPSEVVQVQSRELEAPGAGEVQLKMLAAPINPADLNILEGKYGTLPPLPAVVGNEGVGEIVALGEGVSGLAPGQRVIIRHGVGTWSERVNAAADAVSSIPADLDLEQAAMIMVNPPTAWRMLHDFAKLQPGDWVVQNAANSGVGRSAIAIARKMGVRTLNLVRREELVLELKEAGADEVLIDDADVSARIKEIVGEAGARLGLNAVGGESALRVAGALGVEGVHVTYGAMGRKPLRIPNGMLIFKNIVFRGFWISRWFKTCDPKERDAMFGEIFELIRSGDLRVKVAAAYPLTEAKAAITHASQGERGGKILFRMN